MAGELLYPEKLWEHLAGHSGVEEPDSGEGVRRQSPTPWRSCEAWLPTSSARRSSPISATPGPICARPRPRASASSSRPQLGSLRDLDYGIYPYTTSSNTIAAYAPVGSGLPSARMDRVVGVVKAYSSCVGEGPFTCEWFGQEAEQTPGGRRRVRRQDRPAPAR